MRYREQHTTFDSPHVADGAAAANADNVTSHHGTPLAAPELDIVDQQPQLNTGRAGGVDIPQASSTEPQQVSSARASAYQSAGYGREAKMPPTSTGYPPGYTRSSASAPAANSHGIGSGVAARGVAGAATAASIYPHTSDASYAHVAATPKTGSDKKSTSLLNRVGTALFGGGKKNVTRRFQEALESEMNVLAQRGSLKSHEYMDLIDTLDRFDTDNGIAFENKKANTQFWPQVVGMCDIVVEVNISQFFKTTPTSPSTTNSHLYVR